MSLPLSQGLHQFRGGIHVDGHKALSTQGTVRKASLPRELILPLQQHVGEAAEPLVAVGEHVLKGQKIAKATAYISAPVHAPTSGVISDIGLRSVPHPSGLMALCICLQPDGKDQWGPRNPVPDYRELDIVSLRNRIREGGVAGLGGAGFPSAVKLNPGPSRDVDLLVINGAECEPYISCDQTLMTVYADQVVQGIQVLLAGLGINRCWIAIEDTMPTAFDGLKRAIDQCAAADTIQVKVIPTIYPTGSEKLLIKVLTGREVPSGGLPADTGVVCYNPGTAASIYRAVVKDEPLISRLVTLTGGGLKAPCNMEVLLGTPISHLIAEAGGYTGQVDRLVMGGPMMGFALPSDDLPVVKVTNCVLVASEGEVASSLPEEPCIRCGACADACPVNLLPQQLHWYSKSRQFEEAQESYHLFDCIECGCCSFVCPSHIPLVSYYRFAKSEIRSLEADKKKATRARERHEFREERLELERREKAEAMRKKQEALAHTNRDTAVDGQASTPNQTLIAEAVARARARKEKLTQASPSSASEPESNLATQPDPLPAKDSAIADAKKRAIEMAKQKALAKDQVVSQDQDQAKAAAIAAAKKRAIEVARQKALAKVNSNDDDTSEPL